MTDRSTPSAAIALGEPPSTTEISPSPLAIDLPTLVSRCLGKIEFVHLILNEFQSSVPQQVLNLSSLAHRADAGAIRKSAHSLKGTAATMAAAGLQELAADLETAAAAADWNRMLRDIEGLTRETERCLAEITRQAAHTG
jgi:HPt (histidine-containing phosphotransfer) domain-containing protein